MHPRSAALFAIGLLAAGTTGPVGTAEAQAPPQHLIPQSLQLEHLDTMEQLSEFAKIAGPVGAAASKALEIYMKHAVREREYIMPPLALLPDLADGKVTKDMAWALPMTDRLRAEREDLFAEHALLTDSLNGLAAAADQAQNNAAADFARSAAADSLTDLEILEPTLLLIGDILRAKLPGAN